MLSEQMGHHSTLDNDIIVSSANDQDALNALNAITKQPSYEKKQIFAIRDLKVLTPHPSQASQATDQQ